MNLYDSKIISELNNIAITVRQLIYHGICEMQISSSIVKQVLLRKLMQYDVVPSVPQDVCAMRDTCLVFTAQRTT